MDQDKPHNNFNDAKCDSRGRLWAGTMVYPGNADMPVKEQGSLYSYSHGEEDKSLVKNEMEVSR